MRNGYFTAAFLLSTLAPATGYSASFDCKKAKTEVEKLICADAELSRLDSDLGLAYRSTMKDLKTEQRDRVRSEQQAWLFSRDNCKDRSCVAEMYRLRFAMLSSTTSAFPAIGRGEYKWIKFPKPDIYPSPDVTKLCQGFEKNINSLGPLKNPLLCERPLNPNFKDFSKPEWTKLDPGEHIELIKKMDISLDYSGYKAPPFDETIWRQRLDSRLTRIGLALTKVDLNKDGYPEILIKFNRSGPCDAASETHLGLIAESIRYFVTDEKFSEIMELGPWAWGGELLVHQGIAYFSQVHRKTESYKYLLVLHEPNEYHGDPNNLCELRFMPDKCSTGTRPRFPFGPICKFKYQDKSVTKKGQ
jgi:uncharacterized protein YecT (DUF1311 family)